MTKTSNKWLYPESPRQEVTEVLHGIPVVDPFRWLEDIDSAPARKWVEEQSRFTAEILSQLPEREEIAGRLKDLWNYEKFGVPFKRGGRYFFTRNDGLQNQNVLYWMESLDAEPRVLLDPNSLSEDGTVALTGAAVSDDGRMLAYGLSASGSDWQGWRFRDVATGLDLEDKLEWVKFSNPSFTSDGEGLYYSRYDVPEEGLAYKGANYYQKLYLHRIGDPQSADTLVYERQDQKNWGFSGDVTEDGRYLIISVWVGTEINNGVFYQDLQGDGGVVELLKDFDAAYSFIGSRGSVFYFLTDLNAPMSRLIAIDIRQPERENWVEVIAEGEDTLSDIHLVGGKFVATYLHDAYQQVKVFDGEGNYLSQVDLPGLGTVMGFSGRYDDPETFYHFTSFTNPGTLYRYNVESGEGEVFRQPKVGFDPDDYVTEQVFYLSKDGTRVPMFISHKKGIESNGDNLTYLYAYGGFNIPQTPAFSVSNLVWMERGGVFALANIRGGGEYGKAWHEAGTKGQKQNVFDDFQAAAEWLIENKWTRREKLAIHGRSNGGLLTGACLTQRPDLYGAVVVTVGVLDMLRFHKFTIGWAWVSDYGSPDDPEEFLALKAYSPYHNIQPGTVYPPTLITTGDHDDRVYPAHSFKFAAALQEAQAGPDPALIRIDVKAGHGMGKPTAKLIDEWADILAFLSYYLNNPPNREHEGRL